jgi:hypothetical protein
MAAASWSSKPVTIEAVGQQETAPRKEQVVLANMEQQIA